MDDDPLWSPKELSDYTGIPLATVYAWNSRGTGPGRIRIGRHVRFRRSDVEAWLQQHRSDARAQA